MWGHQQGWELKPHAWAKPRAEKAVSSGPGQNNMWGTGRGEARDKRREHTKDESSMKLPGLFLKRFYSLDPHSPLRSDNFNIFLLDKFCLIVGFLVSTL